jgi:hypothetical protein
MLKATLSLILFVCLFASCEMTFSNGEKVRGNGNFTTSERNVEGTDRIKVSDAIDVILLKGQPHIKVEADALH